MATIKDIAKQVAAKHGIKAAEAEQFIMQMVDVIHSGLDEDRQVKIKGFGTFKLQTMKERNSVNVNTGERVIIDAHDKLAFAPETSMKDTINKPFAQFETVTIDNNSKLLEEDSKTEEEPATGKEQVKEETVVNTEAVVEVKKEAVTELKPTIKEPEPTVEAEPVAEEESEPLAETETKPESESESESKNETRTKLIIIGAAAIAIIAFVIFGWNRSDNASPAQEEKPVAAAVKTSKAEPTSQVQPTAEKEEVQQKEAEEPQVQDSKVETEKSQTETADPYAIYNEDPTIAKSGYIIVGELMTVEAKEGQTMADIAAEYLGHGTKLLYHLEAFNAKHNVEPGQKVRIPKLKKK